MLDDGNYYRLRAIAADLEWMAAQARKEGASSLIESEKKRTALRKILADISRNAQTIQTAMGDPVANEFPNVKV